MSTHPLARVGQRHVRAARRAFVIPRFDTGRKEWDKRTDGKLRLANRAVIY